MLEIFIRQSLCGRNIRIVIDRYKPPKTMGQEILHWVFENLRTSEQILPVILDYHTDLGVEIEITEMMLVKAAFPNSSATALFEAILDYAKRIVITTKVMNSILNSISSHVLMNILLNDEISGVRYYHKVWDWKYLASCPGAKHTPFCMSADEMMQAAVRGEPEAFAYLRAHARPNVTFARTLAEVESFNADA